MPAVCRRIVLLVVACLLTTGPIVGHSQEWWDFRGPTGQGHARVSGLPIHIKPARAHWTAHVPGRGWSSPVLVDGLVVVTTAVAEPAEAAERQSLRVLALDAESGAVAWDREVFSKPVDGPVHSHAKNSFASPSPVSDGTHLFVHFGPDGTACLDLRGKILWKNDSLAYNPQHGAGGSPVLFERLLLFHGDGVDEPFVTALDQGTGAVVWKTARPEMPAPRWSFATPLLIEVDDRWQLISPASHMVVSYDPASGEELWRVRYPNKWSVVPRPVFAHGLVYICTGYDGPAELLAIRPDGRGDITDTHVAWRTDQNVSHNPSPLVIDDELYMVSDNGIASCRRATTGELLWRQRLGGDFSSSPLFADGRIYVCSEQGVCTVFAPGETYQEVATSEFGETVFASPAVMEGALFVRAENRVYRFNGP